MSEVRRRGLAAVLVVVWGVSGMAWGQTGGGLDSLSDDRLMAELAERGLDSLLDRAYEVNKVPPEGREGMKSLLAMRELTDPKSTLTSSQRDELVKRIAAGMDRTLASQKDPKLLVDNAEALIRAAVFRDLNTLEYWGETPEVMGRLRPVAQTVSKMLARAGELARKQADDAANALSNPNDKAALAKYEALDRLATMAEYTRRMNDYAVVASMDPANPERAKLADEVVEYLKQFDNGDSGVQATVRVQMGKVMAAKGGAYDDAIKMLDSVWGDAGQVVPAPLAGQRFEARYFAAVAALKAGKLEDAQKRAGDLSAWIKEGLKDNSQALMGAEAAGMMLQYRIYSAAKQDETARETLMALLRARPEFEGTILEQLGGKIPENADLKTLEVLQLRALFKHGEAEQRRPDEQAVDEKALERGVQAGREILARKGRAGAGGVETSLVEDTAIKLPLLLERQGKSLEAANALLEFIEVFGAGHRNAQAALDEATYLIAQLRQKNAEDVAVGKAYDRLLAIAVNPPFNRVELAYEWARRLQQEGKFTEAVRYFDVVPESDSRAALARFFKMVSIKQMLDGGGGATELVGEARKARVAEVLSLADQVKREATARMAGSGGGKNDQLILVRTALVGADVAMREQKDPKRAMATLEGFEASAAGLNGEKELVAQAMNLRVLALMDLGQNQEATRTLVALLEKTGGAEGADIVFRLLTRLNDEFERARERKDEPATRSLAKARAELSGFLVSWAENNPNPKIKEFTQRYRVFDAETKRIAAGLETDPTARQAGLEGALKLYEGLKSANTNDASVELGIALIDYDLGRFDAAREGLAVLLDQRRLGRPVIEEDVNGEITTKPNARYWEATLKLMRATIELVKQGKADAAAQAATVDGLKALYARWGKQLGGAEWGAEFEKLRGEIAPEYAVPDLSATRP